MKNFADLMMEEIARKKSILVVGIDPRFDQLPASLRKGATSMKAQAQAYLQFGRELIDVVANHAVAVKVQVAFYEALGPEGMSAYAETLAHARRRKIPTIADVKRGDIGSTAEAYTAAYLAQGAPFEADAVTLNPLLGTDAVEPFILQAGKSGKGLFFLVKTSNPSSRDFQDLRTGGGEPLHLAIASRVDSWGLHYLGKSGYSCVGAVVGATFPEEAARIRVAAPRAIFLVPGYGTQGGGVEGVRACLNPDRRGAIVAAARSIIFAWTLDPWKKKYGEKKWQTAVEKAAESARLELQGAMLAKK